MTKISDETNGVSLPYNPIMERVILDAHKRGIGVFTTSLMEDGKVSVRRIPIVDCAKGDKYGL